MGGPKHKWTPEEEDALKAGVSRYGVGKWRSILFDSEYQEALKSRSNVDLKDKWRNISMATVYGSRKKAKLAINKTPTSGPNQDEGNTTALTIVAMANGDDGGQQIVPASPPAVSFEPPSRRLAITGVDKLILEAITNLKKPLGPNKKTILLYVEENSRIQPDMKRLFVTSRLEHLINAGTIVKINYRYSISPNYAAARAHQSSPQLLLEGNNENGVQVDGEVYMINGMTEQEAAAAAARAVAKTEFAIAEAEEAARKAAEAEAELEAAEIFAEAARKAAPKATVILAEAAMKALKI